MKERRTRLLDENTMNLSFAYIILYYILHDNDIIYLHVFIYALVFRVNLPPPWYGPPGPWAPAQRPTIRLCKAAYLPYCLYSRT